MCLIIEQGRLSMISLLLLALSSFFLAVILTPLCRDLFLRIGVVDWPDGQRKFHEHPIARMGGIAIALAYVGSFALLLLSPWASEVLKPEHIPFILRIAPAGLLIFATGVLDDIYNLKPWQKLAGQAAAATWTYWADVRILGF